MQCLTSFHLVDGIIGDVLNSMKEKIDSFIINVRCLMFVGEDYCSNIIIYFYRIDNNFRMLQPIYSMKIYKFIP